MFNRTKHRCTTNIHVNHLSHMKKLLLIAIILQCFYNANADPNSNNLLYKSLCQQWMIKYVVINKALSAINVGHHFDKIVFSKDNKALYNSAGNELKGNWIFKSSDSSFLIISNNEVKLKSKLINISDTSFAFEFTSMKGEVIDIHWVPDNERTGC
jgi:hypothetical protein